MEALTEALGLGKMISAPEATAGGFLHRMEKIHCESGIYAVKCLNPQIMKRPTALNNMVLSERIATALRNAVPVVHAIEWNGQIVHLFREKYYMIYPWVEGKSVFPPHITLDHCAIMGDMLGRIHKENVKIKGVCQTAEDELHLDWERIQKEEWLSFLFPEQHLLEKWQRAANDSTRLLSAHQVISHRDLDPKNVLWQGKQPLLIDWEAAGYVNPYLELMETAYYWADDGHESLNKGLFKAFVAAYRRHIPLIYADWKAVQGACFQGLLGWLYYNIKRGCGLDTVDEEDKELGRQQVKDTLVSLKALEKKHLLAEQWMKEQ